MKTNLIVAALLLPLATMASAGKEYTSQAELMKDMPEIFSGVNVVSPSQMDYHEPNHLKALKDHQIKTLGYVESDSPSAKKLLEIKKYVPTSERQTQSDPNFYWLRKNTSDIKLAFPFNGVTDPAYRLGFVPAGTTVKSAWTGIAEFFEHKEFGTCSITLLHLQSSKMGVKMSKDDVSYRVDNYPTVTYLEGSKKSGFLYAITWATPTFSKTLECAKFIFDKSQMNKMIAYANTLEKT